MGEVIGDHMNLKLLIPDLCSIRPECSSGEVERLSRQLITLDIRGWYRIIVIRRELPRTRGADRARKPAASWIARILRTVRLDCHRCCIRLALLCGYAATG